MVAVGVIPKSPPVPTPIVRGMGYGPVRFTISDTLNMVEQGILREDATIELLDGVLIYRDRFDLRGGEIVEGVKHSYVISALAQMNVRINNERRELRTQSTLVCSETHGPIPDGMVLRGTLRDYRTRLPVAADAFCVIEVADSSYERDSGEKLIGYAKAGIKQYIIINLRARTAEVYTNPDAVAGSYSPPVIIHAEATLALRVGDDEYFSIAMTELLP
jgi:Putative restriction endonuclease